MSKFRYRGAAAGCVLLALAGAALSGCSAWEKLGSGDNIVDTVLTTDLTARSPMAIRTASGDRATPPRDQIFVGANDRGVGGALRGNDVSGAGNGAAPAADSDDADSDSEKGGAGAVANGAGFDMNFDNADVGSVAKVLLGDVMQVTYAIDRRIQGRITLSSGRPVPRENIIPLFESALKLVNAALVRDGRGYRIVPTAEAAGTGAVDRGRVEPGYGISVLPLRYVSAQMIMRAMESFAARPGAIRVETARNILLVQGSSVERASAIETAMALDVDWMRNQSAGIFPLRNSTPETVVQELNNVFGSGKEGEGEGVLKFQPIARLNAVLAVGKSAEQIKRVQTWIGRLDSADYENTALRVYRVRFGNARTMANILREVFTGESALQTGAAGTADLSQLMPGATPTRSTSPGLSSSSTSSSPSSSSSSSSSQPSLFRQGGSNSGDSDSSSDTPSTLQRRPTEVASSGGLGGGAGNRPAVLQNVRISADIENNALLIYANREQYKVIERAITEIDRPPLQVAIDATIAEVTLNKQLEYGIQFFLAGKQGSVGFSASDPLKRLIPGLNIVLGPATDPRVVIDAFRQFTTVKVLSSPSLVVLDNQIAQLQVGDQVPIAVRQATGVTTSPELAPLVNSVEMRDTGVILRVVPRINVNGVITLDVEQEISNVVNPNQQTLTPTISRRRIKSTIAVPSGQTVVLGGLISSRQQQDKSGLPVPLQFNFFGSNSGFVENTELIIFIRPQIIRDGFDAQLVAEELRSKLRLISVGKAPLTPQRPRASTTTAKKN